MNPNILYSPFSTFPLQLYSLHKHYRYKDTWDRALKVNSEKALQAFCPKLPISQQCVCQRSHFWEGLLDWACLLLTALQNLVTVLPSSTSSLCSHKAQASLKRNSLQNLAKTTGRNQILLGWMFAMLTGKNLLIKENFKSYSKNVLFSIATGGVTK